MWSSPMSSRAPRTLVRRVLPVVCALFGVAFASRSVAASPAAAGDLASALSRAAPAADPKVLALATRALQCVQKAMPARTLSVID